MAEAVRVPFVIRGEVIDDCRLEFGGRGEGVRFSTPDLPRYLPGLLLSDPSRMADLYALSMDDIVDYLAGLGERLELARNAHLQRAFAISCRQHSAAFL